MMVVYEGLIATSHRNMAERTQRKRSL